MGARASTLAKEGKGAIEHTRQVGKGKRGWGKGGGGGKGEGERKEV